MSVERVIAVAQDMPFPPELWRRLEAAIMPDTLMRFDRNDPDSRRNALQAAEIVVLPGDTLDDDVLAAPRLKWVHCDHAGLNRSARPDVFARGLMVTGSAGRSAPALAEHAMMFGMVLLSGFPAFYEAQRRHEWLRGPELEGLGALYGRTMGIVGLGHTGRELAVRAKAFGLKVLGYRRRDAPAPSGVDAVYASDAGQTLDALLEQSDIVVLAMSLSNATYKMIDAQRLGRMKPTAILVNLARGEVVDQDALIAALGNRTIAGAGLDVTDPEPLPPGHPLWDLPNVLITPHFTAPVIDRRERSVEIIIENLRRYRAGEPLLNRLEPEDMWSP